MADYDSNPFRRIGESINEIRELAKNIDDPDQVTRAVSGTGGEKELKPETLGAVDPLALRALGRVAFMGQNKYARFQYLKGMPWSWNIDAAYRHFLKFQAGEDRDPESGELHTTHVGWHMLALTSYQERGLGTDDRFKQENTDD